MGCERGHLLARSDTALPRNLRDGKGSLRSTLWADPCRPGEPGVARRVPDRGDDDLTPCHWRVINRGEKRSLSVTRGQFAPQARRHGSPNATDSQADSADSILGHPPHQHLLHDKAQLRGPCLGRAPGELRLWRWPPPRRPDGRPGRSVVAPTGSAGQGLGQARKEANDESRNAESH
jgi:hypothetical protein